MAWERVERPLPRTRRFRRRLDFVDPRPPAQRVATLHLLPYVAALGELRGGRFPPPARWYCDPMALVALALADSRSSGRVWSMLRDWIPALLNADRLLERRLGPAASKRSLAGARVDWLRPTLLNDWGLRTAIERFGTLLPSSWSSRI